jgi:nucleobase:cation symporter-1, NCS1 family
VAYVVTLAIMAPFFVTTPYVGPIAKRLDSVDYSIFIGLAVAAALYWLLCRSLDLERERRMVDEEGILVHARR